MGKGRKEMASSFFFHPVILESNDGRLLSNLDGELSRVVGLLNGSVEALAELVDEISRVGLSRIDAVGEKDGDEFAIRIIAGFSTSVAEMGVGARREGGTATISVHLVVVGVPAQGARGLRNVGNLSKQFDSRLFNEGGLTDISAKHEGLSEQEGIRSGGPKTSVASITARSISILIRNNSLKQLMTICRIVPCRGSMSVEIGRQQKSRSSHAQTFSNMLSQKGLKVAVVSRLFRKNTRAGRKKVIIAHQRIFLNQFSKSESSRDHRQIRVDIDLTNRILKLLLKHGVVDLGNAAEAQTRMIMRRFGTTECLVSIARHRIRRETSIVKQKITHSDEVFSVVLVSFTE